MPFPTSVTLNIGATEAIAEANAKDICAAAGVSFSGTNARKVAVEVLKNYIDSYRARTAAISPSEIT